MSKVRDFLRKQEQFHFGLEILFYLEWIRWLHYGLEEQFVKTVARNSNKTAIVYPQMAEKFVRILCDLERYVTVLDEVGRKRPTRLMQV